MSFNIPSELRFPTPTSKKHLEYCGRLFCTKIEKALIKSLGEIENSLSKKIGETKAFNEKQVLTDIKKRFSTNINKIPVSFKKSIEDELANQLSVDQRLHGKPLWWSNLVLPNKEVIDYKKILSEFNQLNCEYNKIVEQELKKRINCILGESFDAFGVNVLMKSIISTLKIYLQTPATLYFGSLELFSILQGHLKEVYEHLNQYLKDNNVIVNIEDYDEFFRDIKKIPKSWGWEKDGEQIDPNTLSNKTGYGAITVPTDLTLPSLDDFLSGRSTLVEEAKVAVPRFEPTPKEKTINKPIVEKNTKETEALVDITDIVGNIAKVQIEEEVLTLEDYKSKYSKILDIQNKTNKGYSFINASIRIDNTEPKKTDSSIVLNESYMEQSENLQKKIRRIDFYSDNDITLQETIFSDIINELPQDSTAYDIYILKLLNSLFADLLSYKKFNTIHKSIFYKLQIPLWHNIVSSRKFFNSKDCPSRLVMELLLSNELMYNLQLLPKVEETISESKYRFNKNEYYFVNLYENLLHLTNEQNIQENINIKDQEEDLNKIAQLDSCYRAILKNIRKNIERIHYQPAREFIEKIWIRGFVKKYADTIKDNSITEESFLRNMNIAAKLNWQQSMVAIESISLISNNEDNTPDKLTKMKELFVKINAVLPKVCVDIEIDTNYIKALLALLKYKIDSYGKTSNKLMLQELMEKIKPNEVMFVKAISEYEKSFGQNTNNNTVSELTDIKMPVTINEWYDISGDQYKLKFTTNGSDMFVFMKKEEIFESIELTKNKINSLIKSGECFLIKPSSVTGGFLKFLITSNNSI